MLSCQHLADLLTDGNLYCCTSCHEDAEYGYFELSERDCPFNPDVTISFCCDYDKDVQSLTDDQWRAMIAAYEAEMEAE